MAIEARNAAFYCKAQGITVSKLEKELGLYNGYISVRFKEGRKMPQDVAQRIAEYLGVTLEQLSTKPNIGKGEKSDTITLNGEQYIKVNSREARLLHYYSMMPDNLRDSIENLIKTYLSLIEKKE